MGEDTYGNTYENIQDMWEKELKAKKGTKDQEEEVKGRVGDEQSWYKKQVEYWNVNDISKHFLYRLKNLPLMEFFKGMVKSMRLIIKLHASS